MVGAAGLAIPPRRIRDLHTQGAAAALEAREDRHRGRALDARSGEVPVGLHGGLDLAGVRLVDVLGLPALQVHDVVGPEGEGDHTAGLGLGDGEPGVAAGGHHLVGGVDVDDGVGRHAHDRHRGVVRDGLLGESGHAERVGGGRTQDVIVLAQGLGRDQDRGVVGELLDDRVELVGDHGAVGDHAVGVGGDEGPRTRVHLVGAVLAHATVDLALGQVDLHQALGGHLDGHADAVVGLDGRLGHGFSEARHVLVDVGGHREVVDVGDDHGELLGRRVIGPHHGDDGLVVEIDGPELTTHVGGGEHRGMAAVDALAEQAGLLLGAVQHGLQLVAGVALHHGVLLAVPFPLRAGNAALAVDAVDRALLFGPGVVGLAGAGGPALTLDGAGRALTIVAVVAVERLVASGIIARRKNQRDHEEQGSEKMVFHGILLVCGPDRTIPYFALQSSDSDAGENHSLVAVRPGRSQEAGKPGLGASVGGLDGDLASDDVGVPGRGDEVPDLLEELLVDALDLHQFLGLHEGLLGAVGDDGLGLLLPDARQHAQLGLRRGVDVHHPRDFDAVDVLLGGVGVTGVGQRAQRQDEGEDGGGKQGPGFAVHVISPSG